MSVLSMIGICRLYPCFVYTTSFFEFSGITPTDMPYVGVHQVCGVIAGSVVMGRFFAI